LNRRITRGIALKQFQSQSKSVKTYSMNIHHAQSDSGLFKPS